MSLPSILLPVFNSSPLTISFSTLFIESDKNTAEMDSDVNFSTISDLIIFNFSDLLCFSITLYVSINLSLYSSLILTGRFFNSSFFSLTVQGSLAPFLASEIIASITSL
mgnify:CR=1 FL=1